MSFPERYTYQIASAQASCVQRPALADDVNALADCQIH